MNHLIVLYYFLTLLTAMAGLAVVGFAWIKTKDQLFNRIVIFLTFLFFHTLTATLNFYISAVAGIGFEAPVVQGIYTFILFVFFGVFISVIPWFAHVLVDRPWKGLPRILFLVLSLSGLFFIALPLALSSGNYLQALWDFLYKGYINGVWIAMVYFAIVCLRGLGTLTLGDRRRYIKLFVLLSFIFLPGLLADQLWEIFQIKLGWIPRGFTFEPLFLLALVILSLWFTLKRPALMPLASISEDDKAQKMKKFGLSKREWEVLELALEGKTNFDIGEKLFISEGTVKNHIHNILEKTGLRSRWELPKVLKE